MKATVGRIVLYIHNTGPDGPIPNGATEYPALVTQTFESSQYVNLLTFPPIGEPTHRGSRLEGSLPGNWRWPPRDGAT